LKKKYNDILGIIVFGFSAIAFIYQLKGYAWMFVNQKVKVNAEILSYKNQEGGGYVWSVIKIKYNYNFKEYKPDSFTIEGHITDEQTHLISYINKNNPIQVCTKKNLGGFFFKVFFSVFSLTIVIFSIKKNYSFLKRFFIVQGVKLKRKFLT